VTLLTGKFTWLPRSDRKRKYIEYSGGKPSFLNTSLKIVILVKIKRSTRVMNTKTANDALIPGNL